MFAHIREIIGLCYAFWHKKQTTCTQTNLTNNVEKLRNFAHCKIAPHILGRMSLF